MDEINKVFYCKDPNRIGFVSGNPPKSNRSLINRSNQIKSFNTIEIKITISVKRL